MSGDPAGGPVVLLIVVLILEAYLTVARESLRALENDTHLRVVLDETDRPLKLKDRLLKNPAREMTALQLLSVLPALAAVLCAARPFAAHAAALLNWPSPWPELVCAAVASLLIVLFVLLIPRRAVYRDSERTLRATAGFIAAADTLLLPFSALLTIIGKGILRLFGIRARQEEESVTEEEIRMMVDIGQESGAIEENEKELIENIFEFNNRCAEDAMTHRTDVTAIWVGDDRDTVVGTILETGYSRFPVYDEDIDDVIGILNTRDYLLEMRAEKPRSIRELMREAYFVPETVQADVLFRDMQKRKVHMSVVIDEYGGVSGVITMEDLLEEIVGNIYDETDEKEEAEIVPLGEDRWKISGSAPLKDVAEALDIELPEDEGYDTLGGLVFDQFTTIPEDGSHPAVEACGLRIEVTSLDEHRVESAIVTKLPPEDDVEETED